MKRNIMRISAIFISIMIAYMFITTAAASTLPDLEPVYLSRSLCGTVQYDIISIHQTAYNITIRLTHWNSTHIKTEYRIISSIISGQIYFNSWNNTLPNVELTVDPHNTIAERNEGNNIASIRLIPKPLTLTEVNINPATSNLIVNQIVQFNATPNPSDATMLGLTWTSSDPSVGTIHNETGLFTAIAPGTTTITVTSGNITGNATVTVNNLPAHINNLWIWGIHDGTIRQGVIREVRALPISGSPQLNESVTWTINDTTIGQFHTSQFGAVMFTALAPGNATITATSSNRYATLSFEVLPQPPVLTGIDIVQGNFTININEQVKLTPRSIPENAILRTLTWTSSNPGVGYINQVTGIFTARAPGITNILLTNGYFNSTVTVTVNAPIPPVVQPPVVQPPVVQPPVVQPPNTNRRTLREQHRQQLRKIQNEHRTRLRTLREQHRQQLRRSNNQERRTLREQHRQQLRKIQNEHRTRLRTLREQHRQQLRALR